MTPATWEAEYVAWNLFRELMGNPPVSRENFARTVANHNTALAAKKKEDDETLPA